jgi:predicted thioesterase
MRSGLKVGMIGERRFVVEPSHAIDFAEGGMPAVLCTPSLIWFLEHAARDAVVPWLDEGRALSAPMSKSIISRRLLSATL